MNLRRVLTALIVADVFCAFATMGAAMFFHWSLPALLQPFAGSHSFEGTGLFGSLRVLLGATSVGCTLVAWVALPNLWWFGRRLYSIAWASWVLHALVGGASVLSGPGAMFTMLGSVVGGAILGLVYFSDLRRSFERPRTRVPVEVAAVV